MEYIIIPISIKMKVISYLSLWIKRRIHWKFSVDRDIDSFERRINNFSLESDCFTREFLFEGKVIGGQENFGLPLAHKESLFSLLNLSEIQENF